MADAADPRRTPGTRGSHEPTAKGAGLPLWPGAAVATLVACVYLAVAGGPSVPQSTFPHHVLIADGWLHGQMSVREETIAERSERYFAARRASLEREAAAQGKMLTPEHWERLRARMRAPAELDWATFEGRRYGYWGPMPALLLLPWVAMSGLDVSDRLFSCLLAAGTVLLVYLMLREAARSGLLVCTTSAAAGLAVLAGLGTVHFYLAVSGQVWFLAQIAAAFFLTAAAALVLRSDIGPGWTAAAGAAFGAGLLSRLTALATLPFFLAAIVALARRAQVPRVARHLAVFALVVGAAIAGSLVFNYARFGDPFESGQGLTILTGGNPALRGEVAEYGRFSLHYVGRNAYYYFVNPFLRRLPSTQDLTFDPDGNSLFLVTPAFLYLLLAWRRCDLFFAGVWAAVALSLAGLLLLYATGWYQFGNRYLVDFLPLLILLVGHGMRGRLTPTAMALIGLSLVVNAWGTYRFLLEQP